MTTPIPLFFPQLFGATLPDKKSDNAQGRAKDRKDRAIDASSDALRVLIVDDHEGARNTIRALLGGENGIEVISEAANGRDGVRLADALQPDIVLLDITMPTLGGIEAAVRIRRVAPHSRIIFLSQHNLRKLAEAALATGAQGYVVKSTAGTDLMPAIRAVADGDTFVSKLQE